MDGQIIESVASEPRLMNRGCNDLLMSEKVVVKGRMFVSVCDVCSDNKYYGCRWGLFYVLNDKI